MVSNASITQCRPIEINGHLLWLWLSWMAPNGSFSIDFGESGIYRHFVFLQFSEKIELCLWTLSFSFLFLKIKLSFILDSKLFFQRTSFYFYLRILCPPVYWFSSKSYNTFFTLNRKPCRNQRSLSLSLWLRHLSSSHRICEMPLTPASACVNYKQLFTLVMDALNLKAAIM